MTVVVDSRSLNVRHRNLICHYYYIYKQNQDQRSADSNIKPSFMYSWTVTA